MILKSSRILELFGMHCHTAADFSIHGISKKIPNESVDNIDSSRLLAVVGADSAEHGEQ